jgi:hypothetical protein
MVTAMGDAIRMLPIRLLASLCCIAALVPTPSRAQPSQDKPNNAVQTPGPAANATGGYVYVPPNPQPAHPSQSTSVAPQPNYCAPPSRLIQQKGGGAFACFSAQNVCPTGQIPLSYANNSLICCPVVGGGASLAQGAAPNLCCPAGGEAAPNGTCVSVSDGSYPNGTPAVPATFVTCPQGTAGSGPDGFGCYTSPGCPPGFSDIGGVCSSLFGNQTTPPVASSTTPLPGLHVPICHDGEKAAADGTCCQTTQLTGSGVCCPKDQLPQPNGSCGYNPAFQTPTTPTQRTKREETKSATVVPGNGPTAVAVPLQPQPTCAGSAQLVSIPANGINPLTGQPVPAALDVCIKPAGGCPTGTAAAGITFGAGRTFYCCAGGFHSYFGNGMCCPGDQQGVAEHLCRVQPSPAIAMSCPVGSVATYWRAVTVCMTPATCASGFTVSGTSCCPPGMATPNGTCCPPGQPPQADGLCRPNPPAETPGVAMVTPPNAPPPLVARTCPSGLVPREAVAGDDVCVPPGTRNQVRIDNIAQGGRTKPDGGCKPGYVWREARPGDHVCVAPATRTQTWSDNARACGGDKRCSGGVVAVQNPPTALPGLPTTHVTSPPLHHRRLTPRALHGRKRGPSAARRSQRGRASHVTTRMVAPQGSRGGRRR